MRARSLTRLWDSIADSGRDLLAGRRGRQPTSSLEILCRDLLSERGEASGAALAREIVDRYAALDRPGRLSFFRLLATAFAPEQEAALAAAEAYRADPSPASLMALGQAVEAPRQELLRRVNFAPRGTAAIIDMRRDLLALLPRHPALQPVDADFRHLLRSWFNRGFLLLERIDWGTPAAILEKLFEYEAVHEIRGWDDMRRRLEEDRRCFAFFHPALPDEPLIFVEIALLESMPESIAPLLDSDSPAGDPARATTALFYSINNCQEGLRGVSFGSFLIKQVVAELEREHPRLKSFATLSPAPGFRPWLAALAGSGELGDGPVAKLAAGAGKPAESAREPLLELCARYLVDEKEEGEPLDRVARFHLGNGASVERINWLADTSARRLRQSAGIMVNYAYRPRQIERNHETYVNGGRIAASPAVKALLRRARSRAGRGRTV